MLHGQASTGGVWHLRMCFYIISDVLSTLLPAILVMGLWIVGY